MMEINFAGLVLALSLVVACGGGTTEAASDPDPTPVAGGSTDQVAGDDTAEGSEPEIGAFCDPLTECAEGLFCDGEMGCEVDWTCQPMRACTRDLVSYCGCAGVTFQASGNCPGQAYASRGACAE